MKRVFAICSILALSAALCVALSCGGNKTAAPDTSAESGGSALTLDAAIKAAAEQIDGRIDGGVKIAIVNFTSPSDAFSTYVIDELTANLVETQKLSVIDRREIDRIREEMQFQISGEVDDESIQELGRLLGAQFIVSGSYTSLGKLHRIVIRALAVQTAAITVQYRGNVGNDEVIETLLASGKSAGAAASNQTPDRARHKRAEGGQTSSENQQAAKPAKPTAPANGTYTFHPRLQAIQGATPCKVYLDRVVSRNGYLTFYLFDNAVGNGGGAPNPWVGTGSQGVILQDLDNPRKVWNSVSHEMYVEGVGRGGSSITFQGVKGKRFTLNSGTGYGNIEMIFEEIVLGEPDDE